MITVVGGTGFIGAATVRELRDRGMEVAVVSRHREKVAERFPGLGVTGRQADVSSPEQAREAIAGSDALVVALAFDNYPIENESQGRTFEAIREATEVVVGAARETGVGHLVYLSAAGAAPNARYHWFRGKWQAEEAVRASGVPFTIIRPSWVYGPEDPSLNKLLGFGRFLPMIPLFGDASKQRLQPVFIDDVARLIADCLERPEARNQVFEVGGPDILSMDEVIRTALDVSGKRRLIMHQPKMLGRLAASVLKVLPGPLLTPDAVEFVAMDAVVDTSALESTLGFKTTPFREGVETYMRG